jgi:hypothetical protein
MTKVPGHLENPCDALMYRLSGALLPAMRATHHTPNVITTYGFACCLLARWHLWHDRIGPFVALNQLAYFFDCMDGHMARTYGLVSSVGDWYDHGTSSAALCDSVVQIPGGVARVAGGARRRRRPAPIRVARLPAAALPWGLGG